jgi:hypothetical protein
VVLFRRAGRVDVSRAAWSIVRPPIASPAMRTILLLLAALLAAAPADAQRRGEVPRRPRLPAAADSNDAVAYFRLGQELLERRPQQAADAFYWASQINPGWADALYGRYAALLMTNPDRLVRYNLGDRRTREHPEVLRIDSLYFRALRLDPFLRPQFDRDLIRLFVSTALFGGNTAEAAFYTEEVLRDLPPLLRGRLNAGEGRLMQALQAYDEALRESRGRRSEPLRMIRHERGRMFALAGNDSMALVELGHALEASAAEDEGDELVFFYESKAMLEHSLGVVHERAGDPGAAREAYARALLEDLSYFPAHMRLGVLALAEGDSATAERELAMAAEAAADEPTARLAYATMLTALRRLPEAEAELLAVTELAPYFADPWYVLGLVRDWRGEGDSTAAYRAFLARARRGDPRRAQVEQLLNPPASGGG